MNELDSLTNESFNDNFLHYIQNTDTHNHYEFAIEFAREATGFGTIFELFETADLMEYTGFDPEMDMDFDYDGFLSEETADKFLNDLNDGLVLIDLKVLPYFEEFYYDFLEVTGWEGTKEDFEHNLRRSVEFFNFLTMITSEE